MSPDDEREARIRDALTDLMEDGDKFTARKSGERVNISKYGSGTGPSSLSKSHPDLYSVLLKASTRIGNSGGCAFNLFFPAALCALIAVLEFLDVIALLSVGNLIVASIVGLWLGLVVDDYPKKLTYRRLRDDVHDAIRRSGLSPADVLIAIIGDEEVKNVCKFMKLERG